MPPAEPFPLRFERSTKEYRFRVNGNDEVVAIGKIRLLCEVRIHSANPTIVAGDCIIDTGSPISVFPWKSWKWWPSGCVQWLDPMDDAAQDATNIKGINDSVAPARYGWVDISLLNDDPNRTANTFDSPTFKILALFMEQDSSLNRIVLGMAGNALE